MRPLNNGRALLVVLDGVGFSRSRGVQVIEAVWRDLGATARNRLVSSARQAAFPGASQLLSPESLAKAAIAPIAAETLPPETPFETATAFLDAVRELRRRPDCRALRADIDARVRAAARNQRYAPWAAATPRVAALRNRHLTEPTSAAGVWAGFEDLTPPTQGNSDTGHQQIGNLRVAPQTSLEISRAIADGSFFRNPALRWAVAAAAAEGEGALNASFMISGIGGADGRVHSAWTHLEAFLELAFGRCGLVPEQVRLEAILDGRDCPGDSSTVPYGDTGDYLGRLERLLARFNARTSLAWIHGRNGAMDRDFRESAARANYLLLTQAKGRRVEGFAGARAAIDQAHRSGVIDGDIPPTVVVHGGAPPRVVSSGDAFVNLNFRADRQRARTASLLGATEYLRRAAARHGRTWKLDWLDRALKVRLVAMAEYHPDFERRYGARIAFATRPHADNLLALFPDVLPGERYQLVAEGTKANHMGYFIRGRRENPSREGIEDRLIIPSFGEAEGVSSDSDFYLTPQMKSAAIATAVVEIVGRQEHRLVCANLSNGDMLGHLLPVRFEAAVAACEALDSAVDLMTRAARRAGYGTVITSDHGNVEEDSPAHTANDVLTTVVPARGTARAAPRPAFQARLFDASWSLGTLMGVEQELRARTGIAEEQQRDRFVGKSLIEREGNI